MIRGSCLCGAVSFQLNGELSSPRYCHCSNCRKFSGTSPASWAMASQSEMQKIGTDVVAHFNSGRGLRCYCTKCGGPVWFESLDFPDIVGIPLGVIDEGAVPAPERHLWMDSKPDWCQVLDDLPKHANYPGEQ